jgi:hypothetical protein
MLSGAVSGAGAIVAAADGRSTRPSAASILIVVASVKGRVPANAFSSVDRLILAMSASAWRDRRRRAISSRTRCPTTRLSVSIRSSSRIVPPYRTNPHIPTRRARAARTRAHRTAARGG